MGGERGQSVVLVDYATGEPVNVDTSGRLEVSTSHIFSGDIQLGAVELKDGDTNLRGKIESLGGKNSLYVRGFELDRIQEAVRTISGDTVSIKNAVEIMDDWDESDRAKVNPIVGQAGIAAGAGKLGSTVQRITIATDDAPITQISGDTAKLVGALDTEDSDELRVVVTDKTTKANRQTVYSSGAARVSGDVNIVGADIQIGAVELKDGDSDTRADIETDGTKNALFVQANDLDVRDLTSVSDSVEVLQDTAADLRAKINIEPTDQVATQISGDLAAIKTSVEIMDDWDESDRAKVNPIVGQAGIAAGDGILSATVPRVTLAKDGAVVTQISGDTAAIKDAVEGAIPSGDNIIGRIYNQGAGYVPVEKTGNWGAAQTDVALWTPATGKRIHLLGVMVSVNAANNVELEANNVDVVPPMYLAGSGGSVISGAGELWMGDVDEALTLTSTVASNHSAKVWGYEE